VIRLTVCGAGGGEVTGSGYLVETGRARVLVDFGMFQGRGATEQRNRSLGPVDPKTLDAVVVTHAHLDHVGRLPLLTRGGLTAPIHATPATGSAEPGGRLPPVFDASADSMVGVSDMLTLTS
jgi:metallo-beta-lactamase family protein